MQAIKVNWASGVILTPLLAFLHCLWDAHNSETQYFRVQETLASERHGIELEVYYLLATCSWARYLPSPNIS